MLYKLSMKLKTRGCAKPRDCSSSVLFLSTLTTYGKKSTRLPPNL